MDLPDWNGALARACAHAPFLAGLLEREPALAALLEAGAGEEALVAARRAGDGAPDVGAALRRERRALALVLAVGDLAGAFPLARVMAELSDFADRALDAAIAEAIQHRVPDARPAGFTALALGKLGARELNYSSDIDLILLYDPQRLPRRERDDPGEAAERAARRVVQNLATRDAEGYVFRVDLRLRPASEATPPAMSFNAALSHYESSALTWERAAYIRARACAGDMAAGEAFLAAIRPFVWRKSLDFGAIAEIGRLTARIRASAEGAWNPGPGFDLKKGRGGIREIEFFAHTHQLIHGGRHPQLRQRGTRAALDACAGLGLIPARDAVLLGESYDRLRVLEHRLQMVSDQQTHMLPLDAQALENVARLAGLASGAALVAEVAEITSAVGDRYDALMAVTPGFSGLGSAGCAPVAPLEGERLAGELAQLGFADDPDSTRRLAERIALWRSGRIRAVRSDAARAALDRVLPALLAALARAPDPAQALTRFETLLEHLPSVIDLFHLLEARPGLLELLAKVLSLAPPLADALAMRADLLDPLIDASAFDLPGPVEALIADFARGEAGDGYELLLDRIRRRSSEWRFMLGVQLIVGRNDPLAVAAALCRVAEAALAVLAQAAIAEFERAHGRVAGSELVILGLGRLGGGMLTHASDLDLIYLFTDPLRESGVLESDGARPLGITLYFNRLAQRVSAVLSVPTAEGALYEVDTRLRPSGSQGPLAVSFTRFDRYQREEAWTFEHMALCRARVLFGSQPVRAALEEITLEVLQAPRDQTKLRADVLDMRRRMVGAKPPRGPLDAKLARGGLVDLEFLVHYLQLAHATALTPDLARALAELAGSGLVPASLGPAHDALTRLLVTARLLAPDAQIPPVPTRAALASACGYGDWDGLLAGFAQARAAVAAAWNEVFGETLEIG